MEGNTYMNRITYDTTSGEWGINGINIKDVPGPLYGAMCKLHEYEKTGLDPDDIYEMDKLYREKCEQVNKLQDINLILHDKNEALEDRLSEYQLMSTL